jgi:hypothetical protein
MMYLSATVILTVLEHGFQCSYRERLPDVLTNHQDNIVARATPGGSESSAVGLPTSPISLDNHSTHPTPEVGSHVQSTHTVASSPQQNNSNADGLGEVNQHTQGLEFYGPTGTFYFLSHLRSRAKRQRILHDKDGRHQTRAGTPSNGSVVNLLHSAEYSVDRADGSERVQAGPRTYCPEIGSTLGTSTSVDATPLDPAPAAAWETEIERECVRLYFENLHCIHPFLDQAAFLTSCDSIVWNLNTVDRANLAHQNSTKSRVLALFYIVMATGAITAGDSSLLTRDRTSAYLDQVDGSTKPTNSSTIYEPIRIARLYFENAKHYLGDIFESCSLETTQTLFLMVNFRLYTQANPG